MDDYFEECEYHSFLLNKSELVSNELEFEEDAENENLLLFLYKFQ